MMYQTERSLQEYGRPRHFSQSGKITWGIPDDGSLAPCQSAAQLETIPKQYKTQDDIVSDCAVPTRVLEAYAFMRPLHNHIAYVQLRRFYY
jgi:hypothetical protein